MQQRMFSAKGKISGGNVSATGRTGNQLVDILTQDSVGFPRVEVSNLDDDWHQMRGKFYWLRLLVYTPGSWWGDSRRLCLGTVTYMAGHPAECDDQFCPLGPPLIFFVLLTHVQALTHAVYRQLYQVMGFKKTWALYPDLIPQQNRQFRHLLVFPRVSSYS